MMIENELVKPLSEYLLGLADDELILGHRNSEWCGHAPILEEDIAFANLALDEIGHAGLWYGLAAELEGKDPHSYPDRLVYFREASAFRCIQMVELPKGDWAFSMLRQYLFDALEMARLYYLSESGYRPLGDIAYKIRKEEIYHKRHTQAWVRRLGLGTEQSQNRLQNALDQLWPYTRQPFLQISQEQTLVEAGYVPDPLEVQATWEKDVIPFLKECSLAMPETPRFELKRDEHSPHLKTMLTEMQSLARSEPEAEW
jgi:ring-1,2-phenylacetyl-CoA epoxidase subunit PaaC